MSVTASPEEIPAAPTATREPNRVAYSSHPLVMPTVFDEFRVFSIARLGAAGFDYSPEGDVQQEISLGKQLTWRWSIKPRDAEPQELIIKLRPRF